MNLRRRDFFFKTGAGAIIAFGVGPLMGCGGNLITWIGIVIQALTDALPIFKDILPNSVAILKKALQVAKDLQTALKNAAPNAIDFLQQLSAPDGLFNQIFNDVGLITDPAQRRIVSGILLLAGVALRLIASGLHQGVPQTPPEILAKARTRNREGVANVEKLAVQDTLEKALAGIKF